MTDISKPMRQMLTLHANVATRKKLKDVWKTILSLSFDYKKWPDVCLEGSFVKPCDLLTQARVAKGQISAARKLA